MIGDPKLDPLLGCAVTRCGHTDRGRQFGDACATAKDCARYTPQLLHQFAPKEAACGAHAKNNLRPIVTL
jgi:hypothetical protein